MRQFCWFSNTLKGLFVCFLSRFFVRVSRLCRRSLISNAKKTRVEYLHNKWHNLYSVTTAVSEQWIKRCWISTHSTQSATKAQTALHHDSTLLSLFLPFLDCQILIRNYFYETSYSQVPKKSTCTIHWQKLTLRSLDAFKTIDAIRGHWGRF